MYATITTHNNYSNAQSIRIMLSDDSTFNEGFANIYFMCMG